MIDMPKKIIMTDKEKALRAALPRAVRPRLAATLVIMHGPKDNPRILMGRRAARHDFMPSVYVFPGGRVDRGDSYMPYIGELSPRTERILEAAYSPRRARAIVLTAIRETFEESSFVLGQPHNGQRSRIKHPGWQAFQNMGMRPDISDIEVFGRAVTPPHRHKRFDTWFFLKHLENQTPPAIADSSELEDVGWFTFDEIEKLEKQRATVMMLQVLQNFMAHSRLPDTIHYSRMIRKAYGYTQFP